MGLKIWQPCCAQSRISSIPTFLRTLHVPLGGEFADLSRSNTHIAWDKKRPPRSWEPGRPNSWSSPIRAIRTFATMESARTWSDGLAGSLPAQILGANLASAQSVTIAVAVVLLSLLYRFSSPQMDPREPPAVKPVIPLVGHIVGLVRHGVDFFEVLRYAGVKNSQIITHATDNAAGNLCGTQCPPRRCQCSTGRSTCCGTRQ